MFHKTERVNILLNILLKLLFNFVGFWYFNYIV